MKTVKSFISNAYGVLEEDAVPVSGRNALAVPCDLNLDCDVNTADAVMLARFAAEDMSLDIPAAGMGNTDCNADGIADAEIAEPSADADDVSEDEIDTEGGEENGEMC